MLGVHVWDWRTGPSPLCQRSGGTASAPQAEWRFLPRDWRSLASSHVHPSVAPAYKSHLVVMAAADVNVWVFFLRSLGQKLAPFVIYFL